MKRRNWLDVLRAGRSARCAVENLSTLTGGASRTTWAFDAVADGSDAP